MRERLTGHRSRYLQSLSSPWVSCGQTVGEDVHRKSAISKREEQLDALITQEPFALEQVENFEAK